MYIMQAWYRWDSEWSQCAEFQPGSCWDNSHIWSFPAGKNIKKNIHCHVWLAIGTYRWSQKSLRFHPWRPRLRELRVWEFSGEMKQEKWFDHLYIVPLSQKKATCGIFQGTISVVSGGLSWYEMMQNHEVDDAHSIIHQGSWNVHIYIYITYRHTLYFL